jgi:cytoskeletal protein RodZ
MPDHICQESFARCIKAHPDDAVGQQKCKTDIQSGCGFLNIANYTSAASESDSESSTSAAPSSTGGSGGGSSSPSTTAAADASQTTPAAAATSTGAAAALKVGQQAGAGILAAGLGLMAYLL